MEQSYMKLLEIMSELTTIRGMKSLLFWDQQVNTPKWGFDSKAQQIAYLAKLYVKKLLETETQETLEELEKEIEEIGEFYGDGVIANIRILREEVDFWASKDTRLLDSLTKTRSSALQNWKEAREKCDVSLFTNELSKLLDIEKEFFLKGQDVEHPLDAFINDHDKGVTVAGLTPIFERLRQGLFELLGEIKESTAYGNIDLSPLTQMQSKEDVYSFAKEIIGKLGFDFKRGRIDFSPHPFCVGNYSGDDVRITTRFDGDNPFSLLFYLIHEAGHGLYEQGIPFHLEGHAVSWSRSASLHESQSRFWENQIGRSEQFWDFFYKDLQKTFPTSFSNSSFRDFYLAINHVKPSSIRVDADEVTYNLHIIMRFLIEKELLEGTLKPSDLEERWNQLSEEYLGLVPEKPTSGVLQDMHWACGLIGYFPSYTLGNLMAAQFSEAIDEQVPGAFTAVKKGNFKPVSGWITDNIHQHRSIYHPNDLIKRVTGKELSEEPFLKYLNGKFSKVYF